MNKGPYAEPSKVTAVNGEVQVDGPDGVAISLTPDAAVDTSERLLDGAIKAKGQQLQAEVDRPLRRDQPE